MIDGSSNTSSMRTAGRGFRSFTPESSPMCSALSTACR
jgi:hypothetical protein